MNKKNTLFGTVICVSLWNTGLAKTEQGKPELSKVESEKGTVVIGPYLSMAIGPDSDASVHYSVALGAASKAAREYEGPFVEKVLELSGDDIAETYREVSFGLTSDSGTYTVLSQITHVAPGTEGTDAANVNQLRKVKREIDERIGEVDKIKTTKNNVERFQNEASSASQVTVQHRDNAKTALDTTVQYSNNAKTVLTETTGYRDKAKDASEATAKHRDNANTALTEIQTHRDNVYDALTKVKGHENSADSIVKRLKRAASLEEGQVTQTSDGTIHIGEALKGSQIFVSGKQGDRVISGVANGARNRDAVNVSQLNTVRTTANYASQLAQKNSSRINHLEDRLSKTNTKIERGLATSAALTGLFQPYGVGKVNFTASIGGYGASQALAVGTGYRITENAAVKAGVAYSGGNHVMYNASFNFEW